MSSTKIITALIFSSIIYLVLGIFKKKRAYIFISIVLMVVAVFYILLILNSLKI